MNKKFQSYNFISCCYQGKETIFWNGQLCEGESYYNDNRPEDQRVINILHQVVHFDENEVVVFVMGYKYEYDLTVVIDFIKSLSAKKMTIFNDDAHTAWVDKALTTLIQPIREKTHEGVVISHIVNQCGIEDYTIYDCEYNALKYYISVVDPKRYHYYDCFTQTFMMRESESFLEYEPKEDFKYKVCCTNKKPDIHRVMACVHLIEESDAKLTYYEKPRLQEIQRAISFTNTNRHINPPEPTYKLLSEDYKKVFDKRFSIFNSKDLTWDANAHTDIRGSNQIKTMEISRDSFLTVVAETLWDTDTAFWSEKTLKPIYMLRPFVVLSSPGTLDLLRRLGFQTFSSFWDESYDNELNHGKRFEKVMEIVDDIRAKSFEELKSMLNAMTDILEYNRKHCNTIQNKRIL